MQRLSDKVVLVTGGARGIGAAISRAVIREGGHVVICDVLDEEGSALADELGASAIFTHLDVTSTEQWTAAVAKTLTTFGGLNVLVNNAGIVTFGALGQYTREQWDQIVAVNLTGVFLGITAARDALVRSAPSSIVNISSTAGMQGSAELHGYTATKFAVRGLTKSVALELGVLGVRANSVHPGPIRTPMTAGLDLTDFGGALHRIGEPNEVADLVVFLASNESSFSTGSEFVVDGGQLAGTHAVAQDS